MSNDPVWDVAVPVMATIQAPTAELARDILDLILQLHNFETKPQLGWTTESTRNASESIGLFFERKQDL